MKKRFWRWLLNLVAEETYVAEVITTERYLSIWYDLVNKGGK